MIELFICFYRWRELISKGNDEEKIEQLLKAITAANRSDLTEELRQQYVGMVSY